MCAKFDWSFVLLNFIVLLFLLKNYESVCLLYSDLPDSHLLRGSFIVSSPHVVCVTKNKLVLCCLLLVCGDISPNPGPSNVKYQCTVCRKPVLHCHKGIECSRCVRWTHARCAQVSNEDYNALSADESITWHCPDCAIAISLPFADCSLSS